jgi:hypothetical protein
MLFMACFTAYMLRTNISINLIAMVEDTNNSTNGSLPDVRREIFGFIRVFHGNLHFTPAVRPAISLEQEGAVVHPGRILLGLPRDVTARWIYG